MLPTSKALMVQGTTSDAGKSVIVAGLCRILARRGIKVAPFKPQNMALNSAVTKEGGEIGRAQAFQALACGIEPSVHMNPILLKPSGDSSSQVIVQGKAVDAMDTIGFQSYKAFAMGPVLDSFSRLSAEYDSVLIEGAGSPAEVNLRANDIANMGFAEEADVPVIIVADIDRGGVFAHLLGTLDCLSQTERERVIGFVINRFRGDVTLLEPGLKWLEEKTGKPVLGVVPYLQGLTLDAEDAIDTKQQAIDQSLPVLNVVVPVLPRISNHTDFDALRAHPQVNLQYAAPGKPLPPCDLIVIPGSKSVISDLTQLKAYGWDKQIEKHLRYGGKVIGICGGYQMLGKQVSDPLGLEGNLLVAEGLGYLDATTVIEKEKVLTQKEGVLSLNGQQARVTGYEIHMGVTMAKGETLISSASDASDKFIDGLVNADNNVLGTYWHGLFDHPEALTLLLNWAGLHTSKGIDLVEEKQRSLDVLADALEASLDLKTLWPQWYDA